MPGVPPSRAWACAVLACVAVGLVLRIGALATPFGMDDFAHLAMLDGEYPVARAPWDLYAFCRGPSEVAALRDGGAMPWWVAPDFSLAPLRPLSSALMWIDVRVFGASPVLAHAHGLAWWIAMMLAAAWLVRSTLPPAFASAALALFALDDAHAFPVAWWANRNALVSATFAFASAAAYVRARTHGRSTWLAAVAFALALLGGEYGLGAAAYIVAFELGHARGRPGRGRALLLPAVVLAMWAAAYHATGSGAHASSVYADPLGEPAHAFAVWVERVPLLLANAVAGVPIGTWVLTPEGARRAWILGVVAVLLLAAMCARRWPAGSIPSWAWAVAGVGALVPVAFAFPSPRLTLVGALAFDVLLAGTAIAALRWARTRKGVLEWIGWVPVIAVAGVHAMAVVVGGLREQIAIARTHAAALAYVQTLPLAEVATPAPRVIVIAASDPALLLYTTRAWSYGSGIRVPGAWVLSIVRAPHLWTRVSERAFDLVPLQSAWGRRPEERLFRRDWAFVPDERVALAGMEVRVIGVDAQGQPTRVRFSFATELEDPQWRFVVATREGFVPLALPAVGTTLPIPLAPFLGDLY